MNKLLLKATLLVGLLAPMLASAGVTSTYNVTAADTYSFTLDAPVGHLHQVQVV